MRYPYEIAGFVRKSKAFAVDAKFTKNTEEKPLQVFDDTFSRYVFTIIQDSDAITCNVPIEQLAYMDASTNIALGKQLTAKAEPTTNNSPAYTERFVAGSLKGKSPAEVLAENGEAGKKILNEQYNWLKSNLEKYPANKKLMEAIVDASKLNMEELTKQVSSIPAITIMDIDCTPLTRKTRQDGKCFCYEGNVTWTPMQKYPVCVTIKNYYAPVKKNEDGTLNVSLKEKDTKTEKVYSFNLSAQEWLHVIAQMKQTRDCFVMINFSKAYNIAEEEGKKIRETKKEENGAD